MSIKSFLLLGSAVAGAVVLSNKQRRERLLQQGRTFIDDTRRKFEARRSVDLGTGMGADPVTTAADYPSADRI